MGLKVTCRQYRELRNIEMINVGWWNEGGWGGLRNGKMSDVSNDGEDWHPE